MDGWGLTILSINTSYSTDKEIYLQKRRFNNNDESKERGQALTIRIIETSDQ